MDQLRKHVAEYIELKISIKKLTERKKILEKTICQTMGDSDVDTLELPDGSNLNYAVRESLTLAKSKTTVSKGKDKGKGKDKNKAKNQETDEESD
jgi:hypothetical protein